jgi:hypothetical protein
VLPNGYATGVYGSRLRMPPQSAAVVKTPKRDPLDHKTIATAQRVAFSKVVTILWPH